MFAHATQNNNYSNLLYGICGIYLRDTQKKEEATAPSRHVRSDAYTAGSHKEPGRYKREFAGEMVHGALDILGTRSRDAEMAFLGGGWGGWLFYTTPIEDISESAHQHLSDRNAETRPLAAHILRRAQEQLWQARSYRSRRQK